MKPIIFSGVLLLAGFANTAVANCTSDPIVQGRPLEQLLSGSLVCGRPGANYPGGASSPDRWQEEHHTDGELWDYKKGNGNAIDPRKKVGTWSFVRANDKGATAIQVTHSYTGGNSYTWDVRRGSSLKFSFCKGSEEHVVAYINPDGGAGCGINFP